MTSSPIPFRLALAVVVMSLAVSAACRRPGAAAAGLADDRATAGSSAYDAETTDIARLLAGMRPLRDQAFRPIVGFPEWRSWESESRDRWGAAFKERVQPVRAWADAEIKGQASGCQTLLCPFGGTELLTAYVLFPSCEGYVLVGSEPVGQLPSLDSVTPPQIASYADDVRRQFPEVFPAPAAPSGAASLPGPRLMGAIPSLLVQLARLDARVVSASRFDITADGRPLESIPIRGGNARPAALSLTFEVPNGRPQSLVYVPVDLDDAALRKRPGTWTFLRLQAPFATLLLQRPAQGDRFTLLRDLVRDQSRVILDAPPSWAPADGPEWAVTTLSPLPAPAFPRPFSPTLAVRQKTIAKPAKRR
jgi:hypothetical protein